MTVVYFDLETGGVEQKHPTIQLGAVAVEDGREVGAFVQHIAFNEADADPEALKMNHYTAEAWKGAVNEQKTAALFAAWLNPYSTVELVSKRTGRTYKVARLAGYNAVSFDLPRLKAMFGTAFFPCEYLVRDVLQRALFYFDETGDTRPENFKLTTVAAHFGIEVNGSHDALADARICARMHRAIQEAW